MPRRTGPAMWRNLSILAAISVLAAACASTGASPSAAPASAGGGSSVAVELSEWTVLPAPASAAAGPVSFAVTNKGATVHEFVAQLVDWGRQGDVSYIPKMRTQLVAARAVAEALANLATETARLGRLVNSLIRVARLDHDRKAPAFGWRFRTARRVN